MNDPRVTALHNWVEHDVCVDYDNAARTDYEDDLLEVHLGKIQPTLRPKERYASAQEARESLEGFIRIRPKRTWRPSSPTPGSLLQMTSADSSTGRWTHD